MVRAIRLALILIFGTLALADRAGAAVTNDFTDPAAFAAATTKLTTVVFNGILPAGVSFENFNPLVVSGVSFSTPTPGAFVNVTNLSFYSPNDYSAPFIVDSINPNSSNELIISLSQPTHALALQYGGLGTGVATFTLSNNHIFTPATLPSVGQTTFVGFVSTDEISTLTLVVTNGSWVVQSLLCEACSSLANAAAAQARTLLNSPYFLGAKGFDKAMSEYVDASTISTGYTHCDGSPACTGVSDLPGIDCSGLVLWSYNTAFGATTQYLDHNPVQYEGAGAQCSNQQSISLGVSPPLTDLQPGDLLCFQYNYLNGPPENHVAMYVGDGGAVEAYLPGVGVISSSLVPDAQGHTRANFDPKADLPSCASSTSASTRCFDFLGYRRPVQAQIALSVATHSPVSLAVTDPDGFTINANTAIVTHRESLREVPGQLYYLEDSNHDDTVIAPILKPGTYMVAVVPKPGASPTDVYTLTVQAGGKTVTLAEETQIQDIPAGGYGIQSTGASVTTFIPVAIDINPRRKLPRSIDLDLHRKTVSVAILSNRSFNAPLSVERSSLTFGQVGDEQSLAFCKPYGEDVNDNRHADLVCRFYLDKTGLKPGDHSVVLEGMTLEGQSIRGTASIHIDR